MTSNLWIVDCLPHLFYIIMSIKNLLASTLVFTANAACEFGTLTETLEGTAAPGSCCPGPARASGQGECSDSHPQMYTLTGFVCWTGEGNNVGRCTPPAAAAGAAQPTCEDAPNGWKSSTNAPCSTYQSRKWCTPEGGYGTGWMAGYVWFCFLFLILCPTTGV